MPPREMVITFFPFNMKRGIKRYKKLKKENIITTLVFNHYFYVFVNMAKINKNFLSVLIFPSPNGIFYQNAIR